MENQTVKNIKQMRLAREAKKNSGLIDQIKELQRLIVMESFSSDFDVSRHRSLMAKLRELKIEYKKIGRAQTL